MTPRSRQTVCHGLHIRVSAPVQPHSTSHLTNHACVQAGSKLSPSPSPLRWVGYPLKPGAGIKAVRLFKDDRSPEIVKDTCGPTPSVHCCGPHMLQLLGLLFDRLHLQLGGNSSAMHGHALLPPRPRLTIPLVINLVGTLSFDVCCTSHQTQFRAQSRDSLVSV